MSSSTSGSLGAGAPVPVPRTGVPLGITDPVEKARTELKAALAAIEQKANVPKRLAEAGERRAVRLRAFAKKQPVLAVAGIVGAAVVAGGLVWAAVRQYTR